MIKLSFPIPRKIYIAFSGGVDSVAVGDFLRRNHDITLVFVDHNTKDCAAAKAVVEFYSTLWSVPMITHKISNNKPKDESLEEFWRNERYSFFESLVVPVITCHHLDDCVETWVWSSMHGKGKLIPFFRKNVMRPFLTNKKSEFKAWCKKHKLHWAEDSSNTDVKFIRNYIRHTMMPSVLRVNPGIHKTIRKMLVSPNGEGIS